MVTMVTQWLLWDLLQTEIHLWFLSESVMTMLVVKCCFYNFVISSRFIDVDIQMLGWAFPSPLSFIYSYISFISMTHRFLFFQRVTIWQNYFFFMIKLSQNWPVSPTKLSLCPFYAFLGFSEHVLCSLSVSICQSAERRWWCSLQSITLSIWRGKEDNQHVWHLVTFQQC